MTQFLDHTAPVTARTGLRSLSWLLTAVLAVLGTAGCGDQEQAVVGPDICTGAACDVASPDGVVGDADAGGEVDTQADILPQRLVNFYAETKNGNVLQGTVTTATIQIGDDKYPDIKGTQVDFVLQTTNVPNGATVQVTLAGQALALSPPLTVQNGTARIEKVSIPCTTQAIAIGVKVVIAAGDEASAAKSLRLNCDNACTATIDPYDACLTTDADPATPGFQSTFVVRTTTTDCTHAFLVVTDTTGAASQSAKVALSGAASVPITVTLSPDATGLQDASASITASVEDQDNAGRPTGASATEQLTISTEPPVLTLTGPTKEQLLLADDVSPATAGIQVLLTGTVTGLGAAGIGAVAISVDGGEPIQATVLAGGNWQAPLSFPANKTYTVSVEATSSCGLSSSKNAVYSVYVTSATLGFVAPASGSTLLAVDDGNATTDLAYETTLTVSVQNGTLDATVSVLCKNGAGALVPVGSAVIKDPAAATLAVPVSFNTAVLGTAVSCQLIDNAPNPSSSASAQWTIALPAPCLTVADPAAAELVVTTASLPISLVANHLTGRNVTARIRAFGSDTALSVVELGALNAGGLTTDLALAADGNNLPDGVYLIDFAASDGFGNQAALSLCSDPTRTVTLDTTGPALALNLPTKPTLTTFDDPDANTSLFGYQALLAFGITDAAEVCVDLAGDVTCVATLPTDTTATFTTVSFQPGNNVFSAFARDSNGNVTTAGPFSVLLISDVPVVKFIQPAKSIVTASDTLEVIVAVSAPDGHTLTAVDLDVFVNGLPVDATVTDLGNGQYSFVLSDLSATTTTSLQVGAFALGAEDKVGFSSALTITYKGVLPAIAVTAPFNGQTISLASPSCAVGQTNCVRTVTAKTTDVENGSPASLTIVCGLADPVTLTATVQNATASFIGAVLPHGDTCVLTASVVDAAGQSAVSAPNTVTIDRVAPAFGLLVSPPGKQADSIILNATNDLDADPANGLQVSLSIQVSGVSAGQVVTLTVTDDLGATTSFQATIASAVADGQFAVLPFGIVALPDGFEVQLTFAVTDVAGNPAGKTVQAQVFSQAGDARIATPGNISAIACSSDSTCGGSNRCVSGLCRVSLNDNWARQIQYSLVSMPLGSTVRLCSNTPGSAATLGDCATPGWKQLAVETALGTGGTIAFDPPDGEYQLMIEAGLPPEVPFVASLDSTVVAARSRFVLIDTVAPTVTGLVAPTAAGVPNGCLANANQSVADLGAAGGQFVFSVTTSESTSVTLRANGVIVGSGNTSSAAASLTATLTQEGATAMTATPVDAVGNIGADFSLNGLTLNTVAPTGQFSAPTKSPLIGGDSLDVQLASVDLDVEGVTATVADAGIDKANAPFSGGLASFPHAQFNLLTDSSHTLTGTVRDTCNNSSVVATSPTTIVVDTVPATANFVAPVADTTFSDADDASPNGGYQVQATFGTAGATSWKLMLGSECDSAFANCVTDQTVQSNSVTNDGGNEPSLLVTVPFGDSPFYRLRLQATDANGNVTTVDRGFKVQLTGCLVALKGLSTTGKYNTQSCPVPGTNCASVSIALTAEFVGPCGDVSAVRFRKGGAEVALVAPTDSKAQANVTLVDGETTNFEAEVLEGSTVQGSSGSVDAEADLTRPTIAFIAGTVLGVSTPSGGATYNVGKNKDRDGNAAGHQMHALLQVADLKLSGGKITNLQRSVSGNTTSLSVGSPSLPVALSGTTAQVPLQFATLATDTQNVITATVEDAAGNTQSATLTVYVDWTAPGQITLDALAAGDLNPRKPSALLRFAAVGDDGVVGTASSYQVRYSRSPIADAAAFEAACDVASLPNPESNIPAPLAAGLAQQVTVTGADTRLPTDPCKFVPHIDNGAGKYYFAIRAVDDAENAGPISNVVNTSDLRLKFARLIIGAPGFTTPQADDMRRRVNYVGDLNGDGLGDITVGGSAASPICVVYGRSDLSGDISLTATSGTNHICLTSPTPLGVPVGRSGDVNGDGVDDLILGSSVDVDAAGGNNKSARLYLGVQGGQISTTPAVVFKNLPSGAPAGVRLATIFGNFNGDTAGGKPIMDIALRAVTNTSFTYDRVFVVPGSTSWSNASPITIDMGNATARNTHNVATIRLLDQASAGSLFGNAVSAVGNLLPDAGPAQFDEIAIQQYAEPQQLVVVKGRSYTGAIEIVLSRLSVGTGANDTEAMLLGNDGVTGPNNFGLTAFTTDLDGDGLLDLVNNHQSTAGGSPQGGIYVTWGSALTNLVGKRTTPLFQAAVSGETVELAAEGYRLRAWATRVFSAGDFFAKGNGVADLMMIQRADSSDGGETKSPIFGAFDRKVASLVDTLSYAWYDLAIMDSITPGTTFTLGTTAGDFNGDGRPDLFMSTQTNSAFLVY